MTRSLPQRCVVALGLLILGATGLGAQRGAARTSVNRNTNVNVNRNVNVNVHTNVYVHGGGYYGGCCYHPVATAVAVTATVMAIGAIVASIPPSCTVVIANGLTYQHCGSAWYQPQFVGTTTSYVVVAAPM